MYTNYVYLFGNNLEDKMGLIKGVLKEELGNSIRLKESYNKELMKNPGGSIVEKKIRGHKYYYVAFREGRRVRFIYKGKALTREVLVEFEKSKRLRRKHKEMVRQLTVRIKYLRKVLHGKEDV
jgi:hypothetical protein